MSGVFFGSGLAEFSYLIVDNSGLYRILCDGIPGIGFCSYASPFLDRIGCNGYNHTYTSIGCIHSSFPWI